MTGDLTIKSTTKPVTFDAEFTGAATDPSATRGSVSRGSTVINRTDWGGLERPLETGGVLVSEKITLELEISAIKAA